MNNKVSRIKIACVAVLVLFITQITIATVKATELSRSTLLGIVPQQVGTDQSVVLQRVVPNSTASTLGLKAGDKILSINGTRIKDFTQLLTVVRPIQAQQQIEVIIERENKQLSKSGRMQPRPYETSEIATVLYESVSYQGNQLRSITHKPKNLTSSTKAPAIFFIQGYTCSSIDYGMMPNVTTRQLVEQFVAQGYVVFRVEKPGVGDSQSDKQCSEIDFTSESIAFTQALKSLKEKHYVDPSQVFLWGHSLGVLHSAVVANSEPVAGIIGYGGVLKDWYQYMLDIYQQQSVKHFGTTQKLATQNTRTIKPFLNKWLNTDIPWQQIVENQQTQQAIGADLIAINGEQVINRHYSFFRDLNKYDLASYWRKLDAPLLMIHGSLDIQAIEKNWAFDLVELSTNSHSQALEIEGAEHAFMKYNSQSEYMEARNDRSFNPAQPGKRFDSRIGQQTLNWLKTVRNNNPKPQFSGINHLTYRDGSADKVFVGNGFLIQHKGKTYGVTVKHALLETKNPAMTSVSIKNHIQEWRIYPNHHPEQYITLGKLLNASPNEPLDMAILSKDWLIFEVAQNNSNLPALQLRHSPLNKGEVLTAYGCSYVVKDSCYQNQHKGKFIKNSKTNLRIAMPDLDMTKLRGLSGSPVLDSDNKLVGIVSNVLKSETEEGFDFAPANLNYLLHQLTKIDG